MLNALLLGFLLGLRHAFEADHLAAVASLSSRTGALKQGVLHGSVWGLGHSLTLFLFGGTVLWMDTAIPAHLAHDLELVVGLMLLLLGSDVLRRLLLEQFVSHAQKTTLPRPLEGPAPSPVLLQEAGRQRAQGFPLRTLLVGMVHGMAGSAALILLTLETLHSPWLGMLYILLFGIGSLLGMTLLSMLISIPLHYSAQRIHWLNELLQLTIGLVTLSLGTYILLR